MQVGACPPLWKQIISKDWIQQILATQKPCFLELFQCTTPALGVRREKAARPPSCSQGRILTAPPFLFYYYIPV